MPRRPNPVPSYLHHKPKDLAYVRVGGKTVYLGPYGSEASKREYARICAEVKATPAAAAAAPGKSKSGERTVNEVIVAFWRHAQAHYRRADGTPTNEIREYDYLLDPVKEVYGHTLAAAFGPAALKAVRQKYLDAGWARTTTNNRVRRLRHVFKWAAGEELVPPAVPAALAAVAGLQKGRTGAREPDPVTPVEPAHVAATVAKLGPVVADAVRVLRLTGMRPQDVCGLRPADIDRAGPVWVYRPGQHKTAWRGKSRVVAIGPQAQAILGRWAPADPGGYYFSPRRAVELRNERRRAGRETPLFPSHVAAQAGKRAAVPKRTAGEAYTPHALGVAVRRAAELAGVPHWAPNQLRHLWATEVRAAFGLEAAQAGLGHDHADVTQIYAERNLKLACEVAAKIG